MGSLEYRQFRNENDALRAGPALAAAGLTAGVGIVDLMTPEDISVGILYVAPLLAAHWTRRVGFIWLVGLVLVVINQLDSVYGAAPIGGSHAVVMINHMLASLLIVAFTAVVDALCRQSNRLRALRNQAIARADAAMAADRLKDQILSAVSHELRTPLTSIITWSRLLRRVERTPRLLERGLSVIEGKAWLQAHLVDSVIDAADVAQHRATYRPEPTDLARLVGQVASRLQPAFDQQHLDLELLLAAQPAWIRGDPQQLEKVVFHLLHNSLKFTPEGGRVQVTLASAMGQVRLQVTDNGGGFERAHASVLFRAFQAPNGNHHARGLGLGLSIVRGLVDLHGGTVKAESEGSGRGATFTVTLPELALAVSAPAMSPDASMH
ncbi:MAG: HAMP domain-containing histidine kinase [Deltaproteobacteria bacterium]|nr:HAMP domain-containing histidine kinase [Deltaproteobacteria bacterium]